MNKTDSRFEHLNILIVDDERSVVKILRTMLTNIGVGQIMVAHDGLEASAFLDECGDKIDIIICDWNMPHMNGLQLLQRVRSRDPNKAFVMLTGSATHDAVREAKRLNITAFIAKPFSQLEINKKLEMVARHIDQQQFRTGPSKAAL
jgi:two-component system, chemotaxis family, chemotaxis protein CheY